MSWDVEFTDRFGEWWETLGEDEQVSVDRVVRLLQKHGPALGFPLTSAVRASRHGHLRELRIQHQGRPYRVLYAFDPRRVGLLLLGADKTGDTRWYARAVPEADDLYDAHLGLLRKEGQI